MTSPTRAVPLTARWFAVLGLAGAALFGFLPQADAHTDFESSVPSDGAQIDQPISEVKVRFTAASVVAGNGFVVLTPSGELVQPKVMVSEDGREFTLLLEPPLTNGVIGVRWSVRAGDAHPIEGSFSFTTTAAATSNNSDASSGTEAASGSGEVQPDSSGADQASGTAASLEEFLNADDGAGTAGLIGYLGRLGSQAGSLVAIGVVGYALLVGAQNAQETRVFIYLIRQAATLTLVGAVLRAVSLVIEFDSIRDGLISSTGLAVGLRAVGAVAMMSVTNVADLDGATGSASVASRRVLATVGGGSFSGATGIPENELAKTPNQRRYWDSPSRLGPLAVWPAALIAVSFVFDGHTVTKGNHLLTGLVAVVHVTAGAIWLGGLICLVVLARRRGSNSDGSVWLTSVVRFSVVAAVALAVVGAAGLVLTITILDSVSELWATSWGRTLIAKVLIVGVAMVAGAYNHFVLVPEMQSVSAHSDVRQSIVRTMVIELIALGVAVATTAFLVAAAS